MTDGAMNDVFVKMMNFPANAPHEVVTCNEDGSYTIFIDDHLSYQGRLDAYNHAMSHIVGEDFSKYDIQAIEADAHE